MSEDQQGGGQHFHLPWEKRTTFDPKKHFHSRYRRDEMTTPKRKKLTEEEEKHLEEQLDRAAKQPMQPFEPGIDEIPVLVPAAEKERNDDLADELQTLERRLALPKPEDIHVKILLLERLRAMVAQTLVPDPSAIGQELTAIIEDYRRWQDG